MALENVTKFDELLRSDDELQAKIKVAAEAYEGDKADERAVFDAIIAPAAAEAGLAFTFDEAQEAKENGMEISDDELDAVAGGYGCLVLGGGQTGHCWGLEVGAGACDTIGIGIMVW